jgi:hypothetical protein
MRITGNRDNERVYECSANSSVRSLLIPYASEIWRGEEKQKEYCRGQ